MSKKVRIRIQGLAFLVVLALLLGLAIATYQKAFTPVASVTLEPHCAQGLHRRTVMLTAPTSVCETGNMRGFA